MNARPTASVYRSWTRSSFDVHAMPVFFERLQKATRVYETGAPAYLRTHPLTFERIADVQSRIQDVPFRQVPDSVEFLLVRARLSALEGNARTAVANFDELLSEPKIRQRGSGALRPGRGAVARRRFPASKKGGRGACRVSRRKAR